MNPALLVLSSLLGVAGLALVFAGQRRRKERRRLALGIAARCVTCGVNFRNVYAAHNHAYSVHYLAETDKPWPIRYYERRVI